MVNAKGGVGKTTTAISLAALLPDIAPILSCGQPADSTMSSTWVDDDPELDLLNDLCGDLCGRDED